MKDREELTTGEESGSYTFEKPERKDMLEQFMDYQNNGGTMSISDWVKDGRYDKSLAGEITWEYVYNGCYFDIKTTDVPFSAASIFHKDPEDRKDVRQFTKSQAEKLAQIMVAALNEKSQEIKETLNQK